MDIRPRHVLAAGALAGASFLGLGVVTAASAEEADPDSSATGQEDDASSAQGQARRHHDSEPDGDSRPSGENCEDHEGDARGPHGDERPADGASSGADDEQAS